MRSRLAALGASGVQARTFHSAALAQLRHFDPAAVGRILPSKALTLRHIANSLPAPYKFRPAGDLATEIEWARNRRITPDALPRLAGRPRAADPGRPDGAGLRAVRGGEARAGADRLRGPARAARSGSTTTSTRPRRLPRALPRVHGRRVPGRQPAAADAARALARRPRRAVRGRRRQPVDLRLHRRQPAYLLGAARPLPGTRRSSGWSRTTARRRRCSRSRTGSRRRSARREGCRRRPEGRSPTCGRSCRSRSRPSLVVERIRARRLPARGDRDPLPHERPARRLRAGARTRRASRPRARRCSGARRRALPAAPARTTAARRRQSRCARIALDQGWLPIARPTGSASASRCARTT